MSTDLKAAIVKIMRDGRPRTTADITTALPERFGVGSASVAQHMHHLQRMGLVQTNGKLPDGKTKVWIKVSG